MNEMKSVTFSGQAKVLHVDFDDPPRMAKGAKTEAEVLDCRRRARDAIRQYMEKLPGSLAKKK